MLIAGALAFRDDICGVRQHLQDADATWQRPSSEMREYKKSLTNTLAALPKRAFAVSPTAH
jgi:hypothetical protein